ncbi:MAG: hypothetical protein QXY74_01030 [Candidatus Bathyarchaeia archaeon]
MNIKSYDAIHGIEVEGRPKAAISVIEEKGEGFENGKTEIGCFWSAKKR